MTGVATDLDEADGLTFGRKFYKGLNGGGFLKKQSTLHGPASPSLCTVAAGLGLRNPHLEFWNGIIGSEG